MKNIPKYLVIHHSGGLLNNPRASTSWHTVKMIDDDHRNRWPDFRSRLGYWVGYHFVITSDGKVTQTRNIDEEGAHCKGHNLESIGICLVGNFTKGVDTPTLAQVSALRGLARQFDTIKPYNIVPHRFLGQTDCYGSGLSDSWARDIVYDQQTQITYLQQLLNQLMDLLRKLQNRNLGGIIQECEIDSRD